jgi:hypothetical protein
MALQSCQGRLGCQWQMGDWSSCGPVTDGSDERVEKKVEFMGRDEMLIFFGEHD